MIKTGIYSDMNNEDYHSDSAISRSGIMKFLESPYKYWAEYINPSRPPKKSTNAMDFGSAFHMLVLEPELFDKTYMMKPQPVLLKDIGREQYDKYKSLLEYIGNSKYIGIEFEDFNIMCRMRDSLIRHSEAWALIEEGVYEHSYFWEDSHSNLMVKARPDILHPNMIVDLKTCVNASTKSYIRSMIESGYHIQGAMIRDGIDELTGDKINSVINICIEKTYPYSIGIKIIDIEALEIGKQKYKQALLDLKHCIEHNSFEDYRPENVTLPGWAL